MNKWAKKRSVIRRYDLTAQMYNARYAEEQRAKYEAALENIGNTPSEVTLDAGCGTGLLFNYITHQAKMIVGLDISRKTLLVAKEHAKTLTNVHFVCADVDYMPFKEKLFNPVYAMTLIQNSPKPDVTLHEINRISVDNAVIVVTGLRKIFSKKSFEDLIRASDLEIAMLRGDCNLKCYVAVCTKRHHSKPP